MSKSISQFLGRGNSEPFPIACCEYSSVLRRPLATLVSSEPLCTYFGNQYFAIILAVNPQEIPREVTGHSTAAQK